MNINDSGVAEARDRLRERSQNEATCIALNDMLKDAQKEIVRLREENERLRANPPQYLSSIPPDCRTCANRGRVNGLSQESYCDSCVYQGRDWRQNHFVDASKMVDAVKRRCEACAILPCSCK